MVSVAGLVGADADVLGDRPFQYLLLANVTVATGTVLVSPLLASVTGPLDVTDAEAGLLLTAFTAPGIVGIPLVGVAADRVGRKPLIVGGLVLFGAAGTAIAVATSWGTVLALRALQGAGFACTFPVVLTAIGDAYEGPAEAAAHGLRFTTSGLTQAAVPALVGVVAAASWRYPFLLYALALPTALLIHVGFDADASDGPGEPRAGPGPTPDGAAPTTDEVAGASDGAVRPTGRGSDGAVTTAADAGPSVDGHADGGAPSVPGTDQPPGSRTDSATDRAASTSEASDPSPGANDSNLGGEGGERAYLRALARLATRLRVVGILAALGLAMFVYTGLLTYNSFLVVRVLDGTPAQAGLLVTALSLAYAGSASQAGRILGVLPEPAALLAGNALMGLGLAGVGLSGSYLVAVLWTGVAGAGTGVLFTLLRSSVTALSPASLRGGLVGIAEATIRLTASVAPVAMGLLVVALEPAAGATGAIRTALVAVGVGGGVLGSVALLASEAAPPVGGSTSPPE